MSTETTPPTENKDALMRAVDDSPKNVRDETAWLDCFAPRATLSDPVGCGTHYGREGIRKFYRAFIGPHTITFDVQSDFVDPSNAVVVRVVTIDILFANGSGLKQPTLLVYDVERETMKIARLMAHWEVYRAIPNGAPNPLHFLKSCYSMGAEVTRVLTFGPRFVVNYCLGFFKAPFFGGKRLLDDVIKVLFAGHPRTRATRAGELRALFADDGVGCTYETMRGVSPESFMRDVHFLSDGNRTGMEQVEKSFGGSTSQRTQDGEFVIPFEMRTVIAAGTRVVCWYKRGSGTGAQGVVVMDVEPLFLLYSRVKSLYVVEKPGNAKF